MEASPSAPEAQFAAALDTRGWFIAEGAVRPALLDELAAQLEPALARRDAIRAQAGVEGGNDGTLHHLLGDHPCFVDLLDALRPFDAALRGYFTGKYVLNSYGGVINRQEGSAYVHHIHRDIRFSSDTRRFMLNLLVMLDDFTPENGGTWLLSGSQGLAQKPAEERFYREAQQAVGRRGAFLFFDSRLWHAAGRNATPRTRRALTLTFTSPFFKPQLDYPRLLGIGHPAARDPFLRQVIGYNARVPGTLQEYYVPVADRFYQRGQDD